MRCKRGWAARRSNGRCGHFLNRVYNIKLADDRKRLGWCQIEINLPGRGGCLHSSIL